MEKYEYLGMGIYTITEACRLTSIDSRSISRWVKGYKRNSPNGPRIVEPIFTRDFEEIDGKIALSFNDMIEIRFIHAFRKHNVSWNAIRIASQKAAELLQSDHPFSKRKFFTDKKSILTRIATMTGETELLDLVHDQYEIDEIVSPILYEGLDFSQEYDQAVRWWPMGKDRSIVIDPERSFGKPIINEYGIPTIVIGWAFKAGESIKSIASWYEIEEKYVREALEFENKIAA